MALHEPIACDGSFDCEESDDRLATVGIDRLCSADSNSNKDSRLMPAGCSCDPG